MTPVIGIDPGISGAIALVDKDKFLVTLDMPTRMSSTSKKIIATDTLAQDLRVLIKKYGPEVAYIEQVGAAPGQGVSSAFRFGEAYGIAHAICTTLDLQVIPVTPVRWKRAFDLPGGPAGKNAAREMAGVLFPDSAFSRVKDHNRAEAALLAWYGLMVDK
jgi:crossover junction endodeoxyribonuclease RuvC